MSLAFLFHYLMLNVFRMLIRPSSGACDLFVELFHGVYCCGSMCVGVTLWSGWDGVVSGYRLYPDTTPSQPNIKLVCLYSTIKMMHGPINIRLLISMTQMYVSTIYLFYSMATCFD